MTMTEVDVLVVGAGPAGMVAACLLARAGLKTLVLERNDNFDREFRGEVLHPRFHKAMRDVGLFDHLRNFPHEEIGGAQIYFQGQQIGAMDLKRLDRESGPSWWMTQPNLLQGLLAYGQQHSSFELWFHAALRRLEGSHAWVEHEGEEVEVRARVVIGADGRFSTVRKLGDFQMRYDHHNVDVIWFLLPRPAEYQHAFSFFLTSRHNFLILPKHPNLLQCGLALKPGEFSGIRHHPIEGLREELASAHPVFRDFAAGLEDFSPFRPLIGNTALVADWARDGLVLIGDAAHTCSPVGGIGVSIAVETACVAAEVILEGFEKNDLSKAQLARIQQLRKGDIDRVHATQQRVSRIMVRSPVWVRRIAALFVRVVNKTNLFPVLARSLLTQRKALPLTGRTLRNR